METQQSKELPSSLFPKNIVKNEETFQICAVKQENRSVEETCHLASPTFGGKRPLINNRQEMTTPDTKRMKQERDDQSSCERGERNSLSSKTSLHNIVREVAHSFEESILSLQENDNLFLDSLKRPLPVQADTIVFEGKERQPNSLYHNAVDEHEDNNRHKNVEEFATSVDNHKGDVSVSSVMNQVQAETTKPILRTIKGIDTGKSEGFAYDHNFFPKLVGIHSISSPTSSSPVIKSHYDFQQTGSSSPVHENLCQNQTINSSNMGEAPDVFEVDPNVSSPTNQISRNSPVFSPTNFQSEKQYDLLLTFTEDDGKSDMFLVIKDKVFGVRRFEYRGESYLIHTDNKGKTSILAKAPKEEQTGSQGYDGRNAAPERDLHQMRGDTTIASLIASENSTHQSYQRKTSQRPTPPLINSTTVQNSFVQTFGVSATEAASAVPSGQRQTAYNDTRTLRRQLSNQTNSLRTESLGHRQRSPVPAGQQCFPLQPRPDRHQVTPVADGSLQNSPTIPMNVHSQPPKETNNLSKSVNNQQFIVNQGSVDVNQLRSNSTNAVLSPQQYTNSTAQIPHIEYNTALSGRQGHVSKETFDVRRSIASALATGDSRIEQRRKLMNYIAHQLASSEKSDTSTRNSSELINLVSGRREGGQQTNNENAVRTESIIGGQGVAGPLQQLQNLNASLAPKISDQHSTTSRSISTVVNNLGIHDGGQRYHPNQRVVQNGGVVHSQPISDATQHNTNPLQGGVPSNEETEGNNRILQIIESWKRHQQTISSSSSQFQQLRDLLTRVDGSTNSAQNTHSSPVGRTATNHSQLAQPSTVARTTPVISQISYGVISRSTDGENVIPKRTATALVIDQRHSIYVDATDSVIDEESRLANAGQHFSKIRNTVSGPHSNHSGNVAVSFPVPSGQQLGFSRCMQQNSAPVSPSYPSVVGGLLDQRFQSYKLQSPKTARKIDKRCVANNTLNPINIPTGPIQVNPPRAILFVPTLASGQQTGISEVQGNSNIGNPCQGANPRSGEVARPREAAKPCEVSKSCKVVTPRLLDKTGRDDVIEIVDSPPTEDSIADSTLDTENNERDQIVDDQLSCINDGPSKNTIEVAEPYRADKNKTENEVEIKNPSLKRNSVDHKTDDNDSSISQSEEDEQTRINALRAELVKKIQNTNERIEQEKIEWKKSRLNRLKIVLTKKLAKLPGVIDVTVIEDD